MVWVPLSWKPLLALNVLGSSSMPESQKKATMIYRDEMVAKLHNDLTCKQRAHSTCSWGWQAHLLSTCCVSETSSLIFHHYCERAARGIPFKYKPDHILSLHKTLEGLPSHLESKPKSWQPIRSSMICHLSFPLCFLSPLCSHHSSHTGLLTQM